jgi:hypothetical protein
MSVDHPPKSLVWKDRPKFRKVSKIRTVSTIHRTTRSNTSTEDTTNDAAPQPSDGDTASAVAEKQVPYNPPPETEIPAETVEPPVPPRKTKMIWPRGTGIPGFGRYRVTKWYDMETEGQNEHDDSSLPASTSNTRRSIPVPKSRKRHRQTESSSSSQLPDPPRMTSHLGVIESNMATLRRVPSQQVMIHTITPTFAPTQAVVDPTPPITKLYQMRATFTTRSTTSMSSRTPTTIRRRTSDIESQVAG